jgi:hypothetical protein
VQEGLAAYHANDLGVELLASGPADFRHGRIKGK